MSLKVKCVSYDTVQVSSVSDLDVFMENLRHLITNGFELTIDVFGTNISNQDPWKPIGVSPASTRKYDTDAGEHYCKMSNSAGNLKTVWNIV